MNEQEIKQEFDKIWNKINEMENKLGEQSLNSQCLSPTSNNSEKKLALKEFIISISPSNDVKRTACIGYYLEKFDGKEEFTNKDIVDGFRRAKCSVPLNVPDKIQKAISNAWFDKGAVKGTYTLTASGEKIVENKFSNSKDE